MKSILSNVLRYELPPCCIDWGLILSAAREGLSLRGTRNGCTVAGRINHNPRSSVRDTHLFQLALGIDSQWFVSASDFDAAGKRLDIEVDFKSGAR